MAREKLADTLTKEQKAFIKKTYLDKSMTWGKRMNILMDYLDRNQRTVGRLIADLGYKVNIGRGESSQFKQAQKRKHDKTKKRYLITWAQNNTELNIGFWENLKAYAGYIDAEIIVIPGRYSNMMQTLDTVPTETWAEEIEPYLKATRMNIHKYLSILGDLKIQATAVSPLTQLESLTGSHSSIVGSPRVHMTTLPTPHGAVPKIMMTTGACTVRNYTDSKSGKLGMFHHTFGMVIVEIRDSEIFHIRQITAKDNGDFIDLWNSVSNGKVSVIKTVDALVMGDIHVADVDNSIVDATLNDLCRKLYPQNLVLHDIFSCSSVTYHNDNEPFIQYQKEIAGTNSAEAEVEQMLEWLKKVEKYNVVVVRSNHDIQLDKFVKQKTDWARTATYKNAKFINKYTGLWLDGKLTNGIIPYVINQRYPKMKCLGLNTSLKISSFEVSKHGHQGSNGARGSVNAFRKQNTKMITAHSHSACRFDGFLCVGTSTKLNLEYNSGGLSSWAHCHATVNDGKAQHIFFSKTKDGKAHFTTLK